MLTASGVWLTAGLAAWGCAVRPPAGLRLVESATCHDVGAAQGIEIIGEQVFVYGDADTGVLRVCEFAEELPLRPRALIRLTVDGADRISHPTGIAVMGPDLAFIGNSVDGRGEIHRVNWSDAVSGRRLDDAWLGVVADDLSSGGTRPERIRYQERDAIATADYAEDAQLRIYDAQALASAAHTSDPDVLIAAFDAPGWIQNLVWCEDLDRLLLVRNTRAGLGWRLTLADLNQAPPTLQDVPIVGALDDELRGAARTPDGRWILITSAPDENTWLAEPTEKN